MELNLTGQQVLITGGSKGIGLAIARKFAAEGCVLHLAARDRANLEQARTAIRADHPVAIEIHPVDMARAASAKELAAACPGVDILINNAGAIPAGDIATVDEATWRSGWDAKVFGYINMTREFLPLMAEKRSGVIVNVIGLIGEKPTYDAVCRGAANAALIAFTKAVGSRSVEKGVRVIGVNPPGTRTERSEATARTRAEKEFGDASRWREFSKHLPFGRLAESAEIADMVVFLASKRSSYVSGTVINIDGGSLYR